jgi:RNA polymerase sigma-70 factor (ECF subfamily)
MLQDQPFQDSIRRIRQSDEQAAREFLERYWPQLLGAVRAELNRHAKLRRLFDPEDFAQDALFELFAHGLPEETVATGEGVTGLILGTARHMVLRAARKYLDAAKRDLRRQRRLSEDELGRHRPVKREPTPAEAALARDDWEHLLAGLPRDYGRVLELVREGYSEDEAARATGLSDRTVRRIVEHVRGRTYPPE